MSKRTAHLTLKVEPEIDERVRRIAGRARVPMSAVWMYCADVVLPQLDESDSWPPTLSAEQLAKAAATVSGRQMRAPPVPRATDEKPAAPRLKAIKDACREAHPTDGASCILKAPHAGMFHSDGVRQWRSKQPPL